MSAHGEGGVTYLNKRPRCHDERQGTLTSYFDAGGGEFLLGREFGYKERGWGTRERVIYDTLPKQKQNEVLMIR